jgi:membrane-bound serine protease (ClpP class)
VVELEGEINPFRVVFLRRAIEKAQEAEVDTIIFALNTFGGRVDSALQMATLIGALDDIRTIAYIPAKEESTGVSWSAGALISFSCNAIYMAPGTSIGAAAPVFQSSEGTEAAGEKTVSAVRTQMAALAEKNGYPPEVAVAMVDKDAELRMVTGDDGNQSFYLAGRSAAREGGEETAGEQDYTVISPEGKLLALTAGEMERYGISSGTTSTVAALTDALELAVISEIAPDRADRTVSFLTSAGFTSILLTIGLLALYMEISSPGFGVPGTVAITAFAVIFVSSGLLGTLGSLELLLFLLGVVLLAAEVFLIPGFGVAGILGLLSMSMGLLLSRQEFFLPETEWQWDLFLTNITVVFGTLAASFLIMGVLMIFFPRIRLFQRLILSSSEAGYYGGAAAPAAGGGQRSIGSAGGTLPENTAPSSGSPSSVSSGAASSGAAAHTSAAEPAGREQGHGQDRGQEPEAAAGEKSLLGAKGTALTDLRPTGRAEIDGEYYPVVSEGRWIERGAPLRVVEVEGNRIVVEEGEG